LLIALEILVKSTHITSGKRKVMQPTAEDLSNVEIVIPPSRWCAPSLAPR